ncbi:MAG TPA: CHAD domain-containing protein [Terriglobales bacterium]
MRVDTEISHAAFDRLAQYLARLEKKTAPKSIHRFRTYSRRVEAVLCELVRKPSGNQKKLLKSLARLRKKAGKLRDLDVQIAALRTLKIPQEPGRKAQLMRAMVDERDKRERKLPKFFDEETVSVLRKRLRRAVKEMETPAGTDPVERALALFSNVGSDQAALTEEKLHQYRIAGKRARYLAELAGHNPEAQRVVEQLKRMQDVIGDWHDWLELTARAREMFGDVRESALVAALHNVTGAKFRQAVQALIEARTALASKPPSAARGPIPAAPGAAAAASAA